MTLATMLADPKQLLASEADRWIRAIDYYLLADLFGGLVSGADFTISKVKK